MGLRQQPQGVALIDWANPISQGLDFVGNGATGPTNLVDQNRNGVIGSAYATKLTQVGIGVSNTNGGATYTITPRAAGTSVFSIFVVAAYWSIDGSGHSFVDDDRPPARDFQFRLSSNVVEFIRFDTGGNPYFATSPNNTTAADFADGFMAAAVSDGAVFSAWQNGFKTTATIGGTPKLSSGTWWIGNRPDDGGGFIPFINGAMPLIAVWNRALTDTEVQSLTANPWQLFKAQSVRRASAIAPGLTLSGTTSTQANNASTGVTSQLQVLTGTPSSELTSASTGAVSLDFTIDEIVALDVKAHDLVTIFTNLSVSLAQISANIDELLAAIISLLGAPSTDSHTAQASAVQQVQVLSGDSSTQVNATVGAKENAVRQVQVLISAPSTQANASSTAALVSNGLVLVGQPSSQSNLSTTKARYVSQIQFVTGAPSSQANSSSAVALISNNRDLVGQPSSQVNSSFTAPLGSISVNLNALQCSQANFSTNSAISLNNFNLVGVTSSQANAATVGSVTDIQTLTGVSSSQVNQSSVPAITQYQPLILVSAPASQPNASSLGRLDVVTRLLAQSDSQVNSSSSGKLTRINFLSISLSAQGNTSSAVALNKVVNLIGASSVNSNFSAVRAINNIDVMLTGVAASQSATASTAAATLTLALIPQAQNQLNQSSTARITASQLLQPAASVQQNLSSLNVITDTIPLSAAPSAQSNQATVRAVVSIQPLIGVSSTQSATATTARVTGSHRLVSQASYQENSSAVSRLLVAPLIPEFSAQANFSSTNAVTQQRLLGQSTSVVKNTSGTGALSTQVVVKPTSQVLQWDGKRWVPYDQSPVDSAVGLVYVQSKRIGPAH